MANSRAPRTKVSSEAGKSCEAAKGIFIYPKSIETEDENENDEVDDSVLVLPHFALPNLWIYIF